ncbi:hypothetical protein, partial [Candidatus Avelusimicrobium alvi]|uniref:hypothetical protein n=1 Tax=Candidatus Avelusimicrobium alvi TaxID=3416221 RepID=UPI003D0BF082
ISPYLYKLIFPIYQKKKQINPLAGGRKSGLARVQQNTVLLDTWERNIRERKSFPGTVFYLHGLQGPFQGAVLYAGTSD